MARQIRRRFPYLISCLAGLWLLTLAGCGEEARIEGVVVDNFSKPVAGVEVQIAGTTLAVETDGQGRYAVPYYPGKVKVLFRKAGYQGQKREYEVAGEVVIPVETVSLFKYAPDGLGVWFQGATDYIPLEPASIVVAQKSGRGYGQIWTYDLGDEVNEVEINPAARIGEGNRYVVNLVVVLPGKDFVVLAGDGSQFLFQPIVNVTDQKAGVDVVFSLTEGSLHSIVVEPEHSYAVASLGKVSCGFQTCQTLDYAYQLRTKLSGG